MLEDGSTLGAVEIEDNNKFRPGTAATNGISPLK